MDKIYYDLLKEIEKKYPTWVVSSLNYKLLKYINDNFEDIKDSNPNISKEVKSVENNIKNISKQKENNTKKRNKKQQKELLKQKILQQRIKAKEDIKNSAENLFKSLKMGNLSIGSNVRTIKRSIQTYVSTRKSLLSSFALLGSALAGIHNLADFFIEINDMFKSFSRNGVILDEIFKDLGDSLSTSLVPLSDFTRIVEKNAPVISALTDNGLQQFLSMITVLRKNNSFVANFGLSTEDLNDFTSDYFDSQRKLGILQDFDKNLREKSLHGYVENITQASSIMGKNRKSISKNVTEMSRDANKIILLSKFRNNSENMADALSILESQFFGSLSADQLSNDIISLLYKRANNIGAQTSKDLDLINALNAMGLLDVFNDLQSKITSGELTPDQAKSGVKEFRERMRKSNNVEGMRFLIASNNEYAESVIESAAALRAINEEQIERTNTLGGFIAAFDNFMSIINNAMRTFVIRLIDSNLFKRLMSSLENFLIGNGQNKGFLNKINDSLFSTFNDFEKFLGGNLSFSDLLKNVFLKLADLISAGFSGSSDILKEIFVFYSQTLGKITSTFIESVFDAAWEKFQGRTVDEQQITENFNNRIDSDMTGFRGIDSTMSNLPTVKKADGGVVNQRTIIEVAEAGYPEMILPLDKNASDFSSKISKSIKNNLEPIVKNSAQEIVNKVFKENKNKLNSIVSGNPISSSAGSSSIGRLGSNMSSSIGVGRLATPKYSGETISLGNAKIPKEVYEGIMYASNKYNLDPSYMLVMAGQESGFGTNLVASTSSARGVFQFINSTWDNMVFKYGDHIGLGHLKGKRNLTPYEKMQSHNLRMDPKANAIMAALFTKDNVKITGKSGMTDMYLAHFLGAGGAKAFLNSNPNAVAAQLFPNAANANKSIFYDRNGRPRTIGEVYSLFDKKLSRHLDKIKAYDGGVYPPGTAAFIEPNERPHTEIVLPINQQGAAVISKAISPSLMSDISRISDPINSPEYNKKVTILTMLQNLDEIISNQLEIQTQTSIVSYESSDISDRNVKVTRKSRQNISLNNGFVD